MEGNDVVRKLIKKGLSKYEIAKRLGTSWNTVSFWERGVWQPNEKYEGLLDELIEEMEGAE